MSNSRAGKSQKFMLNGHQIYVELQGDSTGIPVVLLHHGLGSVRAWKAQTSALAAAGYYVIAYDRWGYGASDARPALSIPDFRDDIKDLDALLDVLGIVPACLVGHSDGGTIALYYAARFHHKVKCLVTIAAHIYVEPKMETGIEQVRQIYLNDTVFQQAFFRIHGEKSRAVFYGWYDGWCKPQILTWDMSPVLSEIICPSLIVQGMEDEHAEPSHAEHIAAAIPGARLWLVPQARHMLPQENSEEFNRELVAFLSRYNA